MNLPKVIKVCGHDIHIKYKKGLNVDGIEAWGVYDDAKATIWLRMGMDRTRKMEILLHELIHAIDHIQVLNLSEKAVKALGVEVLAVIRNNKLKIK